MTLYSPIVQSKQRMINTSLTQQTSDSLPEFTAEEMAKFTTRLEKEYDLHKDARYNKWLEIPAVGERLFGGNEENGECPSE